LLLSILIGLSSAKLFRLVLPLKNNVPNNTENVISMAETQGVLLSLVNQGILVVQHDCLN
jgi:hypothetical protein